MAELIDSNELMYTKFTPQTPNRFIVYIDGIPSYMIKKIKFPNIEAGQINLDHINVTQKMKGKSLWGDLTMTMYNPIVPSGAQTIMQWVRSGHDSATGRDGYADFYKKDFSIIMLGPVGDKVSEWSVIGAWVKSADWGEGDWSISDQAVEINCTLVVDRCILRY